MIDDTTPARADVSPGGKIAGYLLEEQVGQGGMAVVYRAYDERLERRVALKVLAPALMTDTAFRTRFIRESRAAAAVDHPNIIPVYDAGEAGGHLFISMRYVQGGDVRTLLSGGKPLPPARAWNIITQVASALDAAHARNLIHRDVKPANMLLDRPQKTAAAKSGEHFNQSSEHVYLSDFGISKHAVASSVTSTGQFVGTLDYIAPEQIAGHRADGLADQYSLACAAYELLCGVPPFNRSSGFALINSHLSERPPPASSRRGGLPAAIDMVLAKAMDKTPARRYASCTRFAGDLGRALGLAPGALEAGTPGPAAARTAAHPAPWLAAELAAGADAGLAAAGAAEAGGHPEASGSWLPGQAGRGADYAERPEQRTFPLPAEPAGPGAPGWPRYQPQHPRRSGRPLLWGLLGAAAVAVAGAVVAVTVLNGHLGAKPSASPKARRQAGAISRLLSSSGATRGRLGVTVYAIENNCPSLTPGKLANDVATIKAVAAQRQSEYARALDLRVSAISNGSQLKHDLLNALQASLKADDDYLKWARVVQKNGCSPATSSAAFVRAGGYDNQAVTAKSDFAVKWNPVAKKYGFPTVSQRSI